LLLCDLPTQQVELIEINPYPIWQESNDSNVYVFESDTVKCSERRKKLMTNFRRLFSKFFDECLREIASYEDPEIRNHNLGIYETHYNGDRPFKVVVSEGVVDVFHVIRNEEYNFEDDVKN